MSEIKYTVNNVREDEQTKKYAIEYIASIQNFKEALEICETLKSKFQELGYSIDDIQTWIECEIGIHSNGNYSYLTYAKAKTQHASDYEYVSSDSAHGNEIVSKYYTKERNEKGQKILDALQATEASRNKKIAIMAELLTEIVNRGKFVHAGKDYTVSEKPEQTDDKDEE